MEKSKRELDEEKAKHSTLNPAKKEKKPRRVAVKNASFFLYEKTTGGDKDGDLSPMGFFITEPDFRYAYGEALDKGIPEDRLVSIKGRYLKVTETKRRITVK